MKHTKCTHKYSEKYAIKIKHGKISMLYFLLFFRLLLTLPRFSRLTFIMLPFLIFPNTTVSTTYKYDILLFFLEGLEVHLEVHLLFSRDQILLNSYKLPSLYSSLYIVIGERYLFCFKFSASRFSRSASCSFSLAFSKRLASSNTTFSCCSTCFWIAFTLSRL